MTSAFDTSAAPTTHSTIHGLRTQKVQSTRNTAAAVGFATLANAILVYAIGQPPILAISNLLLSVIAFACLRYITIARHSYIDRGLITAEIIVCYFVTGVAPNFGVAAFALPLLLQVLIMEQDARWRRGFSLAVAVLFFSTAYRAIGADTSALTQVIDYETLVVTQTILAGIICAALIATSRDLHFTVFLSSVSHQRELADRIATIEQLAAKLDAQNDTLREVRHRTRESIREEERVQVKLGAANEQLTQFAYAASHDLKEPIRTIRSFMQLVQRDARPQLERDADLRDNFGFITTSCASMQALLERLLSYNLTTDETVTEGTTELYGDWAMCVLGVTRDLIERRERDSRSDGPPTRRLYEFLERAQGDPHLDPASTEPDIAVKMSRRTLRMVFREIILNALTYHEGDYELSLKLEATRLSQGTVRVAIADNGIGVPANYREQVFSLFKRLHARERFPGTGLGLSLVRRIVELAGGRVWLEGNDGNGTTVYLELPGETE